MIEIGAVVSAQQQRAKSESGIELSEAQRGYIQLQAVALEACSDSCVEPGYPGAVDDAGQAPGLQRGPGGRRGAASWHRKRAISQQATEIGRAQCGTPVTTAELVY